MSFSLLSIILNYPQDIYAKAGKKSSVYVEKSTITVSNKTEISKKALNVIISHLKNDDSDVKSYAIIALSKTHNARLIPAIKKYLNDPSKYVNIAAVRALWELGDVNEVSKLKEIINQSPPLEQKANDPLTQIKIISQNKIREKAIEALVDLEGIKAHRILLDLKENDNFPQIRDIAARELAKIGYTDELDNFYSALNSSDEEIRNQAAQSLIRICPQESNKILSAIKKEKSIRVKMLLFDSLKCAKLNKNEEMEILKYTQDENLTIRYKAISSLLNTKNKEVIEKLKKIYEDTPDINTKLLILKKLLEQQNVNLTEADVDYLNSVDDPDVKRKFIEISNLIPGFSKKYLLNYLDDKNPYVQIDSAIKIIEMERKK